MQKGTFSLYCSKCNKQHDFTSNEADFEATSGSERQMGPETGYTWEHRFSCDKFDNEIEIEYEVWEYPMGGFNHEQINIKGGTSINSFDYDFHGDPDPDEV